MVFVFVLEAVIGISLKPRHENVCVRHVKPSAAAHKHTRARPPTHSYSSTHTHTCGFVAETDVRLPCKPLRNTHTCTHPHARTHLWVLSQAIRASAVQNSRSTKLSRPVRKKCAISNAASVWITAGVGRPLCAWARRFIRV